MDRATEERWRAALKAKGMDVVQVELDLRPGRPEDLVYNVVDEPPYPTRAFCQNWCRGAPPPKFGPSGPTAMIVIMSVLIVVCVIRAITSYSPKEADWLSADQGTYHRQEAPAMRGVLGGSDDTIQNTTMDNQGTDAATQMHTLMPGCSAVSSAGDTRTVHAAKPCSKLTTTGTQQGQ